MRYTLLDSLIATCSATQMVIASTPIKHQNTNCQTLANLQNLPTDTEQVIVVQSLGGFKAEITACQRQSKAWHQVLGPSWVGAIGENGLASMGEKKEGDMKTPVGLYALGQAFGSQPLALKMDYKYITSEDKFIDDPNHKDYNTWVNGKTDAKSYESMLEKFYKMGVVVNYNMNPIIPGAGSAIFMHLRKAPNVSTAGCVSMDEPHLLALLKWLDKKQHPYIFIR
jgi:L,D-peptidoglycan transpeptidase YkuD (ErfK/YbiS/YcfS/YnhG family)